MTTSVPTTKPPGDGWLPWSCGPRSPYDYVELELWREGWYDTSLQPPCANPMMNAVGLYWRPSGPKITDEERLRQALITLSRRRF